MTDAVDRKILAVLAHQGRMTWAELGTVLGLSAPAAAERVRRLEAQGFIQGYAAQLNAEQLGIGLTAFIGVTLARPRHRAGFLERIQQLAEVQECHHVTGDFDYLLKVRCRGPADLERIISDRIKSLAGVVRSRTAIVLSTTKETAALPLGLLDD